MPCDPLDLATPATSRVMREFWALAERVAPVDSTVLITGESGVGKERVARWLHDASARAKGPYVTLNCAATTDTLLETQLFGQVRGAFTGADRDRPGMFEAAHRGTLFLDELGEVSPAMQAKLLRVIQEREVRRVGETAVRRVDLRLIAATNRDLRQEVARQHFREDLYYRLHVIELHVPPLRERLEDLPALTRDLLAQTATRLKRPIAGHTPAVLDCLLAYDWPGNVRELQHVIERACVMSRGPQIDVDDLPEPIGTRAVSSEVQPLRDLEREHILRAVQRAGTLRRAAAQLHISVATLTRRLRAYRRPPSDKT